MGEPQAKLTEPPPAFHPANDAAIVRFGRYEIIGELASGGMGVVYLARVAGEAGFQRLFALKCMHEHLARDSDFVEMLLDEARLTSGIHHPNVVPIVDLGREGDRYFLVMDYIEGCSLAQLCKRHPDERDPRGAAGSAARYLQAMLFIAVRRITPLAQSPTSRISPSVLAANVTRLRRAASIISVPDRQVVVIVASHETACSQPFLIESTHSPPSHWDSPFTHALPVSSGSFAGGAAAAGAGDAEATGAGAGGGGGGALPQARSATTEPGPSSAIPIERPSLMETS